MDTLDIKITNNCNYCCPYCFAEAGRRDISEKTFQKAMLLAKEIGIKKIEFCGGEPLVSKNFNKLVKIARRKGYLLILRTNGILVEKKINVISKNFSWVGISLNGLERTNGKMRISKNGLSDRDKFKIPLKVVNLLKQKNPKIKIILSTTATKENYDEIPELGEYLSKHNVPIDLWKINLFMPRRFRAKANKERYEISADNLEALRKEIDKKLSNKKNFEIIIRKSDVNGGDCLIVSPDGKISVSSTKIADISIDSPKEIIEILENNHFVSDIEKNKNITYI